MLLGRRLLEFEAGWSINVPIAVGPVGVTIFGSDDNRDRVPDRQAESTGAQQTRAQELGFRKALDEGATGLAIAVGQMFMSDIQESIGKDEQLKAEQDKKRQERLEQEREEEKRKEEDKLEQKLLDEDHQKFMEQAAARNLQRSLEEERLAVRRQQEQRPRNS